MNRLRTQKFKPNSDNIHENNMNNTLNKNNNNNNDNVNVNNITNNGLLNKLTKRYSTLSNKISRRHNSGRKSNSPQKTISGSYDMTGARSDDHRPEIGAPILISTTTLDAERLDVTEDRLRQIGGGIATTNHSVRIISVNSSPQIPSSGSENEVYVDALSTTPMANDELCEDDKFELAPEIIKEELPILNEEKCKIIKTPNSHETSPTNNKSSTLFSASIFDELSKRLTKTTKSHSKSAQNLHRSELKVYLQKTSSVELSTTDQEEVSELPQFLDLPKLPELYGESKSSVTTSNTEDNDADKENSSPSEVIVNSPLQRKSEPNIPGIHQEEVPIPFLIQQQHFKSVDSLDLHRQASSKRRRALFNSNNSIDQNGSKSSLVSQNSTIADYDLKSVSCQSLNAQQLFVSIDEINDLTRQINETEDFNQEIDLEYCEHRDNLKPSERRITLLKNKNTRLINFNHNKEKLKKGWHDVKHWIGEESFKIKEAVSKQANLQRTGTTSRLNLSNAECRETPSLHGSVMLRKKDLSCTTESRGNSLETTDAPMDSSMTLNRNYDLSCDNLADEDQVSICTQTQGDDISPAMKRAKREGQNGFEELRRYIKQGGDFGKELILILQERVDSELLYSKSLSKMANKLSRACRELPGSIADAYRGVATEMESRSDIHRQLSVSLTEEIVKPLKAIVDGQHKARKSVESNVDKAARVLAEWRVSEAKAKKASHTAARENEKLQDAMLDVRIQKSPSIAILHQGPNKVAAEKEIKSAEKDCAKLDSKRKKAEEAVKRADVEYYTLCVRAERARVDWEMAVLRGSSVLQNIENQRLVNLKNCVANYAQLTANMNPVLDNLVQRLQPQVEACNVVKDMQVVKNIRRSSEGPSEQLLPDFYCEHTTLAMNRERRKHALIKLLQLVKADLERERRSRNGLKGLSQSMNNQENQNITDKLYHIRSMLTYLEGARFKLHSALLELDHKPRSSHPLAPHIQITRDRNGLQQSVLKVPLWLKNNDKATTSALDDSTSYLETDLDAVSQQTNPISNNVSCTELNKESTSTSTPASLFKHFYRSKSSVEGFSQPIHIVNKIEKTKTMSTVLDDRGQADGGSNQQDSDFDEFSSQDDDDEQQSNVQCNSKLNGVATKVNHYQNSAEIHEQQQQQNSPVNNTKPIILSRCKALYSYTPKLYDELELNPGDIIEVHAKQEDGWWLGALRNQVGIFPATYVEEFA